MIFSSLCADRSKYTLRLFFMLRVYRKNYFNTPYRIVYQRENAFPNIILKTYYFSIS